MDSSNTYKNPSIGGDKLDEEPEKVDLTQVQIDRVINDSAVTKMITFQGSYKSKPIVIRLEKTPFLELATRQAFNNIETKTERSFVNDIYSSYIITPAPSIGALSEINATIVWPANDKVLAKYTHKDTIFITESQEDFQKIIEPYIDNLLTTDKNYNQWVYNYLDGKAETDRVIFNDPNPETGFMIGSDLKWTGSLEDLHLLAICHRRDIRCIRDLNATHLPLLKSISDKGTRVIKEKFPQARGQLRCYIHYQPSFYHFHVHFKMVDASNYQSTDRDNLLTTVINNISLISDYYAKSTLSYPLSKLNPLYNELKKAGKLS